MHSSNHTATNNTRSDEKAPEWFEKWHKETFLPLLNNVQTDISAVKANVSELQVATSPFSSDEIYNIPVVGAEDHELMSVKPSTYTWFKYPGVGGSSSLPVIVGAAHCALSVYTHSPHKQRTFVELPESILKLGVKGVYLYGAYDGKFTNRLNPLPTEKDLIVVEVSSPPPAGKRLNEHCRITTQKKKFFRNSRVIGRGLSSAVSSSDGIVSIATDGQSGGIVKFLLHHGEPGDSGTLLHVKNNLETYSAIAVFNGVERSSNGVSYSSMHNRRGLATLLPPLGALDFLPIDAAPKDLFQHGANVTFFNPTDGRFEAIHCTVQAHPANYPGAVKLIDPANREKVGVYVQAQHPIEYVGMADVFKMRGSF